ncbi:phage tail tip lysozyme [Lichenibacterium dinghuense]|uniref:phage tail tip lysozyme n=1 Tax=Lichenibacterium dinghuense TaxID=2895977 RepID=UPI001F3CEE13|nr:phage tail tip lysozyme [Lichenibacterium sp. 6Y81]
MYHEGGQAPGKGGVGWAQWTGPRRRAFEAWVAAHGLNPTSDEASWRYLTEGDPETPGAIAAVKRESTVQGSMRAFEAHFERAGIKAYGSRMRFANAAMAMQPGGATVMAPATAPDGASSTGTVRAGKASAAVDALDRLNGAGSVQAGQALGSIMHAGQWCADAVNGALKVAGIKGSGSSMANSFKNWGKHVDFSDVKRGDVIFEDHGQGRGHAGFATGAVQRDRNGNVVAIGMTSGNHGNRVRRDYMERVGEITDLRRADEEARREAEQAVLPRRAPAGASAAPERHAAGVDFDHSSLREGIDHLRTFKAELAGLKGGVKVAIDHTQTHKGELAAAGRPGRLRTSLNGHYGSDGRSWT